GLPVPGVAAGVSVSGSPCWRTLRARQGGWGGWSGWAVQPPRLRCPAAASPHVGDLDLLVVLRELAVEGDAVHPRGLARLELVGGALDLGEVLLAPHEGEGEHRRAGVLTVVCHLQARDRRRTELLGDLPARLHREVVV